MKIKCTCGRIISDVGDYLPYKGYIISDVDWNNLWDKIDDNIESKDPDREKLMMDARRSEDSLLSYQCGSCGRLFINDKKNNLQIYIPDPQCSENTKDVFDTRCSG